MWFIVWWRKIFLRKKTWVMLERERGCSLSLEHQSSFPTLSHEVEDNLIPFLENGPPKYIKLKSCLHMLRTCRCRSVKEYYIQYTILICWKHGDVTSIEDCHLMMNVISRNIWNVANPIYYITHILEKLKSRNYMKVF